MGWMICLKCVATNALTHLSVSNLATLLESRANRPGSARARPPLVEDVDFAECIAGRRSGLSALASQINADRKAMIATNQDLRIELGTVIRRLRSSKLGQPQIGGGGIRRAGGRIQLPGSLAIKSSTSYGNSRRKIEQKCESALHLRASVRAAGSAAQTHVECAGPTAVWIQEATESIFAL